MARKKKKGKAAKAAAAAPVIASAEIFKGAQVPLLEHIDSPCFGGKDSLWSLYEKFYLKAVLGSTSAQSQLQALADAGNLPTDTHAQYLWGKILLPGVNIRGQRLVPESYAEAQKYWKKAASHQHAFATEGLGYIAQCRGDSWELAISSWKQTLELCLMPSAAYALGVVHDPLQKAAGPHATFYDFDLSLHYCKKAIEASAGLQEPRGTIAFKKWFTLLSLSADNNPQAEVLPLAEQNYRGLLRKRPAATLAPTGDIDGDIEDFCDAFCEASMEDKDVEDFCDASMEDEDVEECAICLDPLQDPVMLPCGHQLHRHCYDNLLKFAKNNLCPHCRARLPDDLNEGRHSQHPTATSDSDYRTEVDGHQSFMATVNTAVLAHLAEMTRVLGKEGSDKWEDSLRILAQTTDTSKNASDPFGDGDQTMLQCDFPGDAGFGLREVGHTI